MNVLRFVSPLLVVAAALACYPAFVCIGCNTIFKDSKAFSIGYTSRSKTGFSKAWIKVLLIFIANEKIF